MHSFLVHGVNYTFDPNNNKEITNYEWFMGKLSSGNWEKDTYNVFKQVKDLNKTAIDIGGWIGPTAIWLSNNFKNVVVVEADKIALNALKANLKTSNCDNVKIIERPIYSESNVELYFGNNSNINTNMGDSTSQLKNGITNSDDYKVLTISLNDIIKESDDVSFIKIDIEGGEEYIIPELFQTCSKNGYDLWISFHYNWWKNHDLSRFEEYFSLATNNKNIAEYIRSNPFGSLFLKF